MRVVLQSYQGRCCGCDEQELVKRNLGHEPRGTVHYNVHFKDRSIQSRATKRELCGLRPSDIEWIWIIELRRRATPEEVQTLCALTYERSE